MGSRRRLVAVGFACLLVLLVGAERRLAEVHLNRVSSSPAFENDDLLDGDEIRVRLTLHVEDVRQPVVPAAPLTWEPLFLPSSEPPPPAPLRWSSSRAPPPARPAR